MDKLAWIVLSWREGEAILAYLKGDEPNREDFQRACHVLANEVSICRSLKLPDRRNRFGAKNDAMQRDMAAGY